MVGFVVRLVLLSMALIWRADCAVVLITASNYSLPFPDIEASFAPRVPTIGAVGAVFAAEPLNACKPLQSIEQNELSAFLLAERGDCDFVTKVKHAQYAGYAAAIIYNNEDGEDLVTMSGSGTGIDIYAVFVSKKAAETLRLCAGEMDSLCYLFPTFENTARSVIAISFISLLTVFAVLSTLFFVRRRRFRVIGSAAQEREARGMTRKEVGALPVILFKSGIHETAETCAICLEEYTSGEKLRVLPCGHEFHVTCIDQWLTTRRSFCPICKQDAHSKASHKTPSEHTPLLSSCTPRLGSMVSSVPVSFDPQLRSNFADPFIRTPHDNQHVLSCPLSQFYGEDERSMPESCCSYSTFAASTADACRFSSSPCSDTPRSAHQSASNAEEEVVIQVNSDE